MIIFTINIRIQYGFFSSLKKISQKLQSLVNNFVQFVLIFAQYLSTMRILLDKSLSNIEAAEFLHQEEFYAPSVHCSYYSCIQLMRHLIFNKYGIEETEFDVRPEVQANGSHNFLISYLRDKIDNPINGRSFSDNLRRLKIYRINADYKQMNVLKDDSTTSISLAKATRTILSNIN